MANIEPEKTALEYAAAESRLMADMMQNHERENKRLWAFLAAFVVALGVMAGCTVWAVQHMQEVANEAVLTALEAVGQMEVCNETTTTTVQQETGDSGGNNVFQTGENATYQQGGDN